MDPNQFGPILMVKLFHIIGKPCDYRPARSQRTAASALRRRARLQVGSSRSADGNGRCRRSRTERPLSTSRQHTPRPLFILPPTVTSTDAKVAINADQSSGRIASTICTEVRSPATTDTGFHWNDGTVFSASGSGENIRHALY